MAMTVEDLIREREDATSVAYQKFVLLTSSNSDSLFCFFENKDAPYYHMRIKANFLGNVHYIACGNKSMVLKTHKLLEEHREYDKYKLAFFVDKDFDESLKCKFEQLYETPSYSIENLYCSVNAFKEFIKTELQIGEDEPLHNVVMQLYQKLQHDFLNASVLFNAWYKLQKRKGVELNTKPDVSLPNSLISSFIEVSLEGINQIYDIERIIEKYPNHLPYLEEELNNSINELNESDLRLHLRGKFIFNFMITFIKQLVEDGADTNRRKVLTRKIKYHMDNSNALSLLTCYADTPQCLNDFLSKFAN